MNGETEKPTEFSLHDGQVFVRALLPRHREILLDVVLAWARVDTAMTEILGALDKKDLLDAFDEFQKSQYSYKRSAILNRISKLNQGTEHHHIYLKAKDILADFDNHILIRHRIVHANLNGYRKSDPDWLLFFVAERHNDGFLREEIPIQIMIKSRDYADRLEKFLRSCADVHYGPRNAAT